MNQRKKSLYYKTTVYNSCMSRIICHSNDVYFLFIFRWIYIVYCISNTHDKRLPSLWHAYDYPNVEWIVRNGNHNRFYIFIFKSDWVSQSDINRRRDRERATGNRLMIQKEREKPLFEYHAIAFIFQNEPFHGT